MTPKHLFDKTFALAAILLTLPITIIAGVLIAVTMPGGPVLFRQKRVGQGGKLFTIVKFRTMRPAHSGSTVSVAGESRITPLGAFLRRFKIDELPEMLNVLAGDMSLVGPRPDVPGYADSLSGDARRILEMKPGITGPATLRYRYEESLLALQDDPQSFNDRVIFPDKVRINLDYMNRRSFALDLKIILATAIPSLETLLPEEWRALQPKNSSGTTATQLYVN